MTLATNWPSLAANWDTGNAIQCKEEYKAMSVLGYIVHILLIMVFPGFQRKMQNIQINVATNFYSKVCEMMLRCASGGVSVVCKCGQ